jgi:hypothetical protein
MFAHFIHQIIRTSLCRINHNKSIHNRSIFLHHTNTETILLSNTKLRISNNFILLKIVLKILFE